MYICICKGVSEKDLQETIQNGCSSLNDVQNSCGAGTDCGACCSKLEKYLSQLCPPPVVEASSRPDSSEA